MKLVGEEDVKGAIFAHLLFAVKKALDSYDPEKARFITWVFPFINKEMQKLAVTYCSRVHIPINVYTSAVRGKPCAATEKNREIVNSVLTKTSFSYTGLPHQEVRSDDHYVPELFKEVLAEYMKVGPDVKHFQKTYGLSARKARKLVEELAYY